MTIIALPKKAWTVIRRCSTATWCFIICVNYITLGKSPEQMIDPNTRTDYNKMKKLIRLDKLDGNRKGVLRKITEEGEDHHQLSDNLPRQRDSQSGNLSQPALLLWHADHYRYTRSPPDTGYSQQ